MQVLKATRRTELKKSSSRALRNSGNIPAVVYGQKVESTPIYVAEKDFTQFEKNYGLHTILKLDWGTDSSTVMVGEVQRDFLRNEVLHVDFREADLHTKMNVEIPIEWIGELEVEKKGLILQRPYFTLEVSALPTNLPDKIEVDVTDLEVGDTLTVADIQLAEGVEALLDGETVLASVLAPTRQEEATDEVVEGSVAEEPTAEAGSQDE